MTQPTAPPTPPPRPISPMEAKRLALAAIAKAKAMAKDNQKPGATL